MDEVVLPRSHKIRLVALITSTVLVAVVIALGVFLLGWFGFDSGGSGDYPSTLTSALPAKHPGSSFVVLTGRDAAYLNATQARQLGVRYVTADTPSTSESVISVNTLGPFDWSATAQHDGHCYAIRLHEDPAHPEFGQTYFAELTNSSPCDAARATSQTVRGADPPA